MLGESGSYPTRPGVPGPTDPGRRPDRLPRLGRDRAGPGRDPAASTSRSSAADRCLLAPHRRRAGPAPPSRWRSFSRCWSPFRCCASAPSSGRRAPTSPASSAPPASATAVRNTVVLASAVTVAAVPIGVATGPGPAPARPARAGLLAGRGPAAGAGPRLRPRLQLDAGVCPGRLHRRRARAALGRPAGPGRGVARPGRQRRAAGLPGRRRRAGRPGRAGPRARRPGVGRGRRDGAAHHHAPAGAAGGDGRRRAGLRADAGHLRDPAGARCARRLRHRDHADLRRPLPRRRPGVLPRGGDARAAARPRRGGLRRTGRRAARSAAPVDAAGGRAGDARGPGTAGGAPGPGRSRWPATSSSPWRCRWRPWCCRRSPAPSACPRRRATGAWTTSAQVLTPRTGRGARPERRPGRRRRDAARRARRPGGGARAPPRRAADGDPGHPHPRAARLDARGRAADRLRPLAVRHADPDPAGLPGQALGLRAPADRRRARPAAPRRAARRPGERRRPAHRRPDRRAAAARARAAGGLAGLLPHRPARGHDVEPALRGGQRDAGGRRAEQPGARPDRPDRGALRRPLPARRRAGPRPVVGASAGWHCQRRTVRRGVGPRVA